MAPTRHQREPRASRNRSAARSKKALRRSAMVRELCVGCIVFLPEQVEGSESVKCVLPQCRCNNSELDKEGYKHYVVILDIFQSDDRKIECYIAKLTSQEGTARYSNDRIKISQTPSESPPDEFDLHDELYLENGNMPKQSYISLSHAFQISPLLLRPLNKGVHVYDRRLSEQSYIYLMRIFGLKAAIYEDTNILKRSGTTIRTVNAETPVETFNSEIPETRLLHVASSSAASFVAPTGPIAILALPNSVAESISLNSALEQQNTDHQSLRRAFTLPSRSESSRKARPNLPAPQIFLNHDIISANWQRDASEPQRSALEREYPIQREGARIRARDIESGPGRNGGRDGPGIWFRCARYLLAGIIYMGENTPWKKFCWFLVCIVTFYKLGIFNFWWLAIKGLGGCLKVLGGWLKVACVWTGRGGLKTVKVLGPWLKRLSLWVGGVIFKFMKILGGWLKCLGLWIGGGILELMKRGLRYLG